MEDDFLVFEGLHKKIEGKDVYVQGIYNRSNIENTIMDLALEFHIDMNEERANLLKERLFDEYLELCLKHLLKGKEEIEKYGKVLKN